MSLSKHSRSMGRPKDVQGAPRMYLFYYAMHASLGSLSLVGMDELTPPNSVWPFFARVVIWVPPF